MTTIPEEKQRIARFLNDQGVPKGATHFRLTIEGHAPVIDKIKELDVASGCSGTLEFGRVTGMGRNREFNPIVGPARKKPAKKAKKAPRNAKEPAPAKAGRKGKHGSILGFSACAVLKALGHAGVKYPEADAILKREGIEMPKASVSVQLGFGRNEKTWERHGKPAPITKEQIAGLREGAS